MCHNLQKYHRKFQITTSLHMLFSTYSTYFAYSVYNHFLTSPAAMILLSILYHHGYIVITNYPATSLTANVPGQPNYLVFSLTFQSAKKVSLTFRGNQNPSEYLPTHKAIDWYQAIWSLNFPFCKSRTPPQFSDYCTQCNRRNMQQLCSSFCFQYQYSCTKWKAHVVC